MAQMVQKPVFALPGCQRMSVNTLSCDTLGLAEGGVAPKFGSEKVSCYTGVSQLVAYSCGCRATLCN